MKQMKDVVKKLFQAMVLAVLVASVGVVGVGVVEGCAAAQKGAAQVVPVLDKISDAAQYLDAAWGAFCLFKPSVCQQYGGEYQRAKGILAASRLVDGDDWPAARRTRSIHMRLLQRWGNGAQLVGNRLG